MPLLALQRLLTSLLPAGAAQDRHARRAETQPQMPQHPRSSWAKRLGLGQPSRKALAAARIDFTGALSDLRTPAALDTKSRVVVARSLHELWHYREQIFSLVACRYNQAEAARRLAALDRHFVRRPRRAASNVPSDPRFGDAAP
jgi:hypothetical protein